MERKEEAGRVSKWLMKKCARRNTDVTEKMHQIRDDCKLRFST